VLVGRPPASRVLFMDPPQLGGQPQPSPSNPLGSLKYTGTARLRLLNPNEKELIPGSRPSWNSP
jgi:hypothetical protein